MGKSKKDLMKEAELADEVLQIPEDEIWTYRIEGLQAPRIVNKTVSLRLKVLIIAVLAVAITLSVYFSIRAVSHDEYKYAKRDEGYEFVKYSNSGSVTEVTVDTVDGDETKPVTQIHEYAFNCDEKIVTVRVGRSVKQIDGKSFYSCTNLENIFVDEANPYYCDIDGVLYDKQLSTLICYPISHDIALIRKAGYDFSLPEDGSATNADIREAVTLLCDEEESGTSLSALSAADEPVLEKFTKLTGVTDYRKFVDDYRRVAGAYVLPSSVTEVGKLAFAYSSIREIYLPEGLKSIGTLGFFKAQKLREIYSYTCDQPVTDTVLSDTQQLRIYRSLPEGLVSVGSDAFTYDRGITYMYVPASVQQIGHHAFYNMAYKSGDNIEGTAKLHVALDRDAFHKNTKTGESWLPKVEAGLFKKNIEVIYSSQREK